MFYKFRNVRYIKNFDQQLYTEYLTSGEKVFSDLPSTSFIIQDFTIICDGKKVGLLRLTRPKKLRIFDTLNWMLCQIWISPKYQNQGIGISLVQKIIKSKTSLEYIFFNISKTKPGLIQFMSRIHAYKVKPNSTIYIRLDVDPRYYLLYYIDTRKQRMQEDINIENLKENDIIFQNEDILIAKNKDKVIIKNQKHKILLLPFKQTEKGTYVLVECKRSKLSEDNLNYKCISQTYNQSEETPFKVIQQCLYNVGIKIQTDKPIIPQGNILLDDNIIENTTSYIIDMNKEGINELKLKHGVCWIPLRKVLNRCIHSITLALCLKLMQYLVLKQKEQLPEKTELENMSVASLVSYESPSGKVSLKYPYPEDLELEEDNFEIF